MTKPTLPAYQARQDDPRYLAPEDRPGLAAAVTHISTAALMGSGRWSTRETREALPTSYQGQSLDVVWDVAEGASGLPWNLGRLRLEQRPDLEPLLARGRRGSPGEYQRAYRASPWVQSRLREIVSPVASAPWGLSFQPETPPDQRAFQEACWRAWTERGAAWCLADWIEVHLRTMLVAGFAWAEIVWPQGAPVPPLPQYRDPSSVEEWILQGDTPVGLVQSVNSIDSYGNPGPVRVAIPWEKIIHTANEPSGPADLEGRSLLRPAWAALQLCADLLSLQGLSASLNAAGSWVVTASDPNTPRMDDDVKTQLQAHFTSYQAQHVPWLIMPPGWSAELLSPDSAVVDVTAQLRLAEQAAMTAMSGSHGLIGAYGDGSRALAETARADARDLLDVYASRIARVLEQLLARLLRLRFPAASPVPAVVTYASVEVRDPAAHVVTLATYLRDVRPALWPDAQAMLDEALDLPPAPQTAAPTEPAQDPDATLEDRQTRDPAESLPVPEGVQEAAARALRWIAKGLAGDGFTDTGRARAAQLARGGPVSPKTVRRMAAYFRRHTTDRAATGFEDGEEGFPSAGRVAWDAWGGDPGRDWSYRLVDQWDSEEE